MLLHLLPLPRRTFVRACPVHRLELAGDSLTCPAGHGLTDDDREGQDGTLRWLVLEQPSGRVAARVYTYSVAFERWFEDAALDAARFVLAGRTRGGFTVPPVPERAGRGGVGAVNAGKLSCPHGHPYDAANTMWRRRSTTGHPKRVCRACNRAAKVVYQSARRERHRASVCSQIVLDSASGGA